MIPSDYINDVLNGEAILDDIDEYVSFWHERKIELTLQQFLGFTDYEYGCWLERGNSVVRDILFCRRSGRSLEEYDSETDGKTKNRTPEALKKYLVSA